MGKPAQFAISVLEEMGVKREGMVMVGDNLNTDILFAKRAGIASVLLFSGATTEEEAKTSEIKATHYLARLGLFKG